MRSPFSLILAGSTTLAVVFLALPLVALFLRIPPGALLDQLGSDVAREALVVSLKTSAVAHVVVLLVGTPVAYLLGTRVFRGRGLLIGLVELPLVLPPAVAGIALLAAFGNRGLLGGSLEVFGVSLPFTQAAVVVAIVFVSSPFYIRQAAASFAAVDPLLLDASRTLGRGPGRTFLRVALPLAVGGLAAGSSLAFARGLGEFGATIIFAGSFAGVTRTAPLAIYAELDRDFDVAVALGVLLVVFSIAVMAIVALLLSWTRSSSRSPFLFAPSNSDSTSA
ncbi:MAG: molybdate ABC transporter permease subunit [Actinobacteria bacterium]|nr:molybdate ABC transporter permease subunit [Actinomycetota bacterium]